MNQYEQLKSIRLKRAISQSEMANELGISQQVYSNYEKGINRKYSPEILKYIQDNFSETYNSQEFKDGSFVIEMANNTISDLAKSNLSISESNNKMADGYNTLAESNKTLAESNKELVIMCKANLAPKDDYSIVQKANSRVLEVLATNGIGGFWKTKEEGLIILGKLMISRAAEVQK